MNKALLFASKPAKVTSLCSPLTIIREIRFAILTQTTVYFILVAHGVSKLHFIKKCESFWGHESWRGLGLAKTFEVTNRDKKQIIELKILELGNQTLENFVVVCGLYFLSFKFCIRGCQLNLWHFGYLETLKRSALRKFPFKKLNYLCFVPKILIFNSNQQRHLVCPWE